MNARSNWWLMLSALLVAGYVWFIDRPAGARISGRAGATALFAPIPVPELVALELNVSNRVLAIQRPAPAAPWRLRLPLVAEADAMRIQSLLQALEKLQPTSYIDVADLTAAGGLRAYGLDGATGSRLVLTLQNGKSVSLQLGGFTVGERKFYLQRIGNPGIFIADRALLDALPVSADDWRDRSLFPVPREGFDRIELRGTSDFRAELERGGEWRLKRPLDARADSARIHALIGTLRQTHVEQFLADRPVADLESYGLQSPAAEIVLGRGAADLVQLSVGSVVTNDPSLRYVLRRNSTSLVTVPAKILVPLSQPLAEYRDRRLFGELSGVTAWEFQEGSGVQRFRVERTNVSATNWWVTSPRRFLADASMIEFYLRQFGLFEIADFTADIVPDLARYGLAPPQRNYRLLSGTNLLAELQIGTGITNRPTLLHVRRIDEPAVYGLPTSITGQLAHAAEQLHDWRFNATNAVRLQIRREGRDGFLVRTNGTWNTARGKLDSIAAANLDATLNGLGMLRSHRMALSTQAQEQQFRRLYHFDQSPLAVTIELTASPAAGFTKWSLEFGGEFGASRVALARFDDEAIGLRIQVPLILFEDLMRDLIF